MKPDRLSKTITLSARMADRDGEYAGFQRSEAKSDGNRSHDAVILLAMRRQVRSLIKRNKCHEMFHGC
jgi:hypothetical protein